MQFLGSNVQTHGRAESARQTGGERIALALGPESKAQFLPQFDAAALPPADYAWIDLPELTETAWEECLFEQRPTLLVTGWGTPAIPGRFARSPEMSLRYICHLAGSVRQIVPRALVERGVRVSNWGTAISGSVAEHAVLLTLAALRNLPAWDDYMRRWPQRDEPHTYLPLETRTLRGKRVGLHGFGSIARELVGMLRAFGAEVSSYSWGVPPALFERYGVRRCDSLETLFSGSDVLIECEALTAHNQGTVNAAMLRRLPAGAVFVNVGRGHVVDEAALAQVAAERGLRLGLDVYCEEPLPASSPLRALPGALLSPHIAGPARDAFGGLCQFALANLRRHLLGEPIEAEVTLEVYDRST